MGLFSTKTKSTSNETATTTPNVPSWYQEPATNLFGKVNSWLNTSTPQSLVTPANPLQTQAMWGAEGLKTPDLTNAKGLVGMVMGGGGFQGLLDQAPAQATLPAPVQAAQVAGVAGPQVAGANLGTLGDAAQVTAPQFTNPVATAGFSLPQDIERVKSASLLEGLDNYMNPYLDDVVNSTMADLSERQGADRAAYAAQGARNGAFGGSRFGLGETNLRDAQSRTLASTIAGLRGDAWNSAVNASNLDAGRRQETGIFNAGQKNDRDNLAGQLGAQTSIANAGFANDRDLAKYRGDLDVGMANADAANRFALTRFGEENATNRFNAGALNDAFGQEYGVRANNASQNASAENAFRQQRYGTTADMNQFNASQANDYTLSKAGLGLNAAGLLGDFANSELANKRANIGLQSEIGSQMRDIDKERNLADLNYLLAGQGLLDPSIASLFTGQTVNSSGTSTNKKSGGLGFALLSALSNVGSAFAGK